MTIVSWGVSAFLGFLYWRSRVERQNLREEVKTGARQLDRYKTEFSQRLARHHRDLEAAQTIAEGAEKAKKQFFSQISAELREPLHTILGYTQLLERERLLDRISKESLQQIRRSGDGLLALIEDILALVQLNSHHLTLQPTNFSLRRFLDSIELTVQPRAVAKGLQLLIDLPPDVPAAIKADESKLRQILLNILDNALEFTETGSITLRVEVADRVWVTEEDPEHPNPSRYSLFFEVEDTGRGIPPPELDRIFDPFGSIETPTVSGVGLPLAKRLAQLMDGEIAIDSTPGQGTLVKIQISVQGVEEEAWEGMLKGTGRLLGLAPDQEDYRILLADDRLENRELLAKFLVPLGFKVKEATNGQEAISLWSTWRPQMIWIDTRMPIMSGSETIQQIRHLESLGIAPTDSEFPRKTIIIALVAGTLDEEVTALQSFGCDDVLRKPFDREIVLEKIARYLGVRYLYETDPSDSEPSDEEDEDLSTLPLTDLPHLPTTISSQFADSAIEDRSLQTMPLDWIEALYDAASAGDSENLSRSIAEIGDDYPALSTSLTALVEQYNFRKIRELSQTALADRPLLTRHE